MLRLPNIRPRPATLALACAIATHLAHAAGATQAHRPPAAAALSPGAVRLLSFGNAALTADVAYLRAVSAFGDRTEQARGYPHVASLLRQSAAHDPNFAAPYLLAGGGLAFVRPSDPDVAALLREGCARRPDVWELQLYRGFWAYQRDHDVAAAAAAFAAAARAPGAPVFLGLLAVRLAASTEAPRAGLAVLDAMLQTVTDPGLREGLLQRQAQLLLEHRLARLNRAARHFRTATGRSPRDVDELLAAAAEADARASLDTEAASADEDTADAKDGAPTAAAEAMGDEPLTACLADPFGGQLWLAADGAFVSDHDAARLRLQGAPGGSAGASAPGEPPAQADERVWPHAAATPSGLGAPQ